MAKIDAYVGAGRRLRLFRCDTSSWRIIRSILGVAFFLGTIAMDSTDIQARLQDFSWCVHKMTSRCFCCWVSYFHELYRLKQH